MAEQQNADMELRASIRRGLVESGVPNPDEVLDLAFHAVSEAMNALNRVIKTGSSFAVTMTAFDIALQVGAVHMQATHERSLQLANKLGADQFEFEAAGRL